MIFPGRTLIVTVAVLPALIFFLHKVTPSLSEQGQDEFYQKMDDASLLGASPTILLPKSLHGRSQCWQRFTGRGAVYDHTPL